MGNKHQFVSLCSDVTREVFHHYLLFSWRSRSVASIEEGVLSEFGTWAESIHYLCSIILVRELPKCFYSWPCFKFKSIGLSSLGIQSFKIKLYLPLIIINLQFSPWLIFRNVHNEKLLKKNRKRGNGNLPSTAFFSFMTSMSETVLLSGAFCHLFAVSVQWLLKQNILFDTEEMVWAARAN